jgi:WhiB family redox-sensing transcriptional regulator
VALTWIRTPRLGHERLAHLFPVDSDPDIFFPVGSSGPAVEQIDTARRICNACPVASECLEFALATNQEAGIWGGLTEEDRRRLRKSWLSDQRLVAHDL